MGRPCDYCQEPSVLVGGDVIYPHRPDLAEKKFWNCVGCVAYVGCHPGTEDPLGRLANADLRKAKMAAHSAFDPLWKECGLKRGDAYAWLREAMGLTRDECHIGMFDETTCMRVVSLCEEKRKSLSASLTETT